MRLALTELSKDLSAWLSGRALPLWSERGIDRRLGGFHEAIGLDGTPVGGIRRARVQPRQVYVYLKAGDIGWNGPWQEAVDQGLAYFDRVFLRQDGTYGAIAAEDGTLMDESFDLYNQAFAIFAFANAAMVYPHRATEFAAKADALLQILKERMAHPLGGFEESDTRILPLRSNPHMHLFEAALAWEAVPGIAGTHWSDLADEIAELCMTRFIDRKTGVLREFFDGDWQVYPGILGRRVEPGHQFEWAWLLVRWGRLRHRRDALSKARRLFDIGTEHGLCPRRRVAIMAIDDDFAVDDPIARLWPQTEWLKSALVLAELSAGIEREYYVTAAEQAGDALRQFLATDREGLWRDKMHADGTFVEEPSPASSLYHIVCAITDLDRLSGLLHKVHRHEQGFGLWLQTGSLPRSNVGI